MVRMDRGGPPRSQEQSHAVGYRCASLWCGRLAPVALRREPRSCARSPRLGRAGGDRARRRCTRPVRECWPDVRPGRACRSVVSRRHAADGRASCGSLPARTVYGREKDWLRADHLRRLRNSLGAGGDAIESRQTIGHLLFLGSALAWAFYTVAMRRARLDGLHAAAIAAVGAVVLYLPVYLMVAGTSLALAPWSDIALQAFVQGILTAIVSLIFYGRAVGILGASSGAAFAALSPAMTAIMAIPVLGEWPTMMDWIAIAAISVGVYVVSGGPLPRGRA